jgi:hypothetical protein
MRVIKFRDTTINGIDESTLKWTKVTDKDDLMVEVFTSEKLFEDLSIYWKELEKRADSTIYMSYDWVYNWWQHFGKNEQRSLYLITFWDGTKLVGVAPFYMGYSKFGSVILERRLQLIGSGGSTNEQLGYRNDYGIGPLDIIVDRSYSTPIADMLAKDILTYKFLGADVLKFPRARDDSYIMNYLYPRLQNRIGDMRRKESSTLRYLELSQEECVNGSQPSAGNQSQHFFKNREDSHEYAIEDVSENMGQITEAADNIIALYQRQSNHGGLPGMFYDKRFIEFFKDTLKYAFKNNWLWFKQAQNDEDICASRVALRYNGRYYDYISSTFQVESTSEVLPSFELLAELVKDGIEKGAQRIELSKASEKYNSNYRSSSLRSWTLSIPLRERKMNIPFLLNRIGSFFYKYLSREVRFLSIQRQKKGLLKMIKEYVKRRLKNLSGK